MITSADYVLLTKSVLMLIFVFVYLYINNLQIKYMLLVKLDYYNKNIDNHYKIV